jgi:hypothetical protein
MTNSLQILFAAIHQVQNEQDLRSLIVPQLGEYFAATRSGFFSRVAKIAGETSAPD